MPRHNVGAATNQLAATVQFLDPVHEIMLAVADEWSVYR